MSQQPTCVRIDVRGIDVEVTFNPDGCLAGMHRPGSPASLEQSLAGAGLFEDALAKAQAKLLASRSTAPAVGDFIWFDWDEGEPFQCGVPTEAEVLEVEGGEAGDWFARVRIHTEACDVWMSSADLCEAQHA